MLFLIIFSLLVREPMYGDKFYPGDKEELKKILHSLVEFTQYQRIEGKPVILFCPHAGYIYSGKVAAQSYREIQGEKYDIVVLLGPAHRYPLRGISVGLFDYYRTPLGKVEVAKLTGEKLLDLDFVSFVKEAHIPEHSIEVQIPFLQYCLKKFKILPVLVGAITREQAEKFAESLLNVLKGKKFIIIVSTDLSHYKSYELAKQIDRRTINSILTEDPLRLLKDYRIKKIEMCGFFPALVALNIAKIMGDLKAKELLYLNSGDTYGDKRAVVGYASIVFYKEFYTDSEKKFLLRLARESIKRAFAGEDIKKEKPDNPRFLEKRGVFVTLRKNGILRGCIGIHKTREPLYITVQKMARAAAFEDPRFPPLREDELDSIDIAISIYLYSPRKIKTLDEYIPGKHGIILVKGLHQATFLPEVPLEQKWDKEETLHFLSLKAGLPGDGWKTGCTFYVYETVHFSEQELHLR